jgi:hypothetical protein
VNVIPAGLTFNGGAEVCPKPPAAPSTPIATNLPIALAAFVQQIKSRYSLDSRSVKKRKV